VSGRRICFFIIRDEIMIEEKRAILLHPSISLLFMQIFVSFLRFQLKYMKKS
jgi:hypothetical protein